MRDLDHLKALKNALSSDERTLLWNVISREINELERLIALDRETPRIQNEWRRNLETCKTLYDLFKESL